MSRSVLPFVLLAACVPSTACRSTASEAGQTSPFFTQDLEPATCGAVERLHTFEGVLLASQPDPEDFELLQRDGLATVVNQRLPEEIEFDERALVEGLGMTYLEPSFRGVEQLTDDVLDESRAILRDAERPLLLHCASANRVGAVWLAHRMLDGGLTRDAALTEARRVGLRSPAYEARVLEYVARRDPSGNTSGLAPATRQALLDALDDERRAQAEYRAVIERFGERPPFANIVHAEGRHAAHLIEVLEAHGLAVPADPWADRSFELPATFAEACARAAEAERANVALYDRVLPGIEEDDVREVFELLRSRSLERHLPAFERWATRG